MLMGRVGEEGAVLCEGYAAAYDGLSWADESVVGVEWGGFD